MPGARCRCLHSRFVTSFLQVKKAAATKKPSQEKSEKRRHYELTGPDISDIRSRAAPTVNRYNHVPRQQMLHNRTHSKGCVPREFHPTKELRTDLESSFKRPNTVQVAI